jgi:hypothetical protein
LPSALSNRTSIALPPSLIARAFMAIAPTPKSTDPYVTLEPGAVDATSSPFSEQGSTTSDDAVSYPRSARTRRSIMAS